MPFERADVYERGRPSYPAELVATVARELDVTAASTALDLVDRTEAFAFRSVPDSNLAV